MITTSQQYGIKIARSGYSVTNAPDWALLFNSSWPSLTIAFEAIVTQTTSSFVTTIPHGLGIYPLTMAWITDAATGANYGRLSGESISVDNKNVTLVFTPPDNLLVKIRCYNVDISVDNSYPLPASSATKLPYDSNYGIKIVKSGKSIASHNLNDFILHSRAQSPAILDIATDKGAYFSRGSIVYPLSTPYLPWFIGASNNGGSYSFVNESSISTQIINGKKSLILNLGGTGQGSLIVMRDPLFPPSNVQVVY